MKYLLFFFGILCGGLVSAQNSGVPVTVIIDNVPEDQGKVMMSLHDENSFMQTDGIAIKSSEIKDGKISITFEAVQPGNYGVISFHDKNDNGRLDFTPTGMPTEALGVSNNPMLFGPPTWTDAKFQVNCQRTGPSKCSGIYVLHQWAECRPGAKPAI